MDAPDTDPVKTPAMPPAPADSQLPPEPASEKGADAKETLPSDTDQAAAARDRSLAAAKVRRFPQSPGVYLMKDAAGRVIYVGKAKNLRSRAGSYFLKAAAEERRTADLVREIRDIDYLEADSEVDALLMESRLIKDVQPRFNTDLKDDKTFPYLQITTREDYPRVEVTREPRRKNAKLYGPFTSAGSLRVRWSCCSGSLSSAPAPSTLKQTTPSGSGIAHACWHRLISAPHRATYAFPKRTTGETSSGCEHSLMAINSG